jgi:phospholipase C
VATNPIKYVIVVMLENRSYDNMLGALYSPDNASPYQFPPPGQSNLNGFNCNSANPNPSDPSGPPILMHNAEGTTVGGTPYPATAAPVYDPGEWFGDMAQQITGAASIPSSNPYDPANQPPYNPQSAGLMQGFTLNYADVDYTLQQQAPAGNIPDVMTYLTPAQVPVTAFLAANYGVCDQWFASAPAQTYVNRAFALTAAPGMGTQHDFNAPASWVNDWVYVDPFHPPTLFPVPSLLKQLDDVLTSPPNWKVYFHDYSIAMETVAYVAQQAANGTQNVATFDNSDYPPNTTPPGLTTIPNTFVTDLAAGTLPTFSWIEPRYNLGYAVSEGLSTVEYAPNSNHPGAAVYPSFLFPTTNDYPPIDVMSGELFLMQLYNALQANSEIWEQTLLIITYDEHGGLYDHVPPPFATPPQTVNVNTPAPLPDIPAAQDPKDAAAAGFNYNVLGVRVPAIIVSPWITPGSTIRDPNGAPFDHTSMIKTMWDLFPLSQSSPPMASLTKRDAAAPSLKRFISDTMNKNTQAFSGVLLAAPSFLDFRYNTESSEPSATQVIVACDGGTKPPTVSCSADWLTLTNSTTGNTLTLTVSVNTNNLGSTAPPAATIEITSANGATPSPLAVNVTMTFYS